MHPIVRLMTRRLGSSLVVLFGVSVLIFAIARVMPGDPARIALGPNASDAQVQALRVSRHLNEPLPTQYVYFLEDLAHGNLGTSLYTNRPVTTDIAQFLPASLELVLAAGLLMVGFGIPLGVVSARHAGTWIDTLARFAAMICVCTPAFVWGVIFQLVFAYFVPIFPLSGQLTEGLAVPPRVTGFLTVDAALAGQVRTVIDAAYHLVLPAFALALAGIGQTARLTRSSMLEIYRKLYTEMARAYGFPESRISWRYAFRPALIPTFTILGLDFAALLANAFLVEHVFVWPGLSRYGVEVILHKDLDAIMGTVLIIAFVFVATNMLVDMLVAVINPRIRLAQAGAAP